MFCCQVSARSTLGQRLAKTINDFSFPAVQPEENVINLCLKFDY